MPTEKLTSARVVAKMALLVAVTCISSYVVIPLPFALSPLSLQTLFVNLTAFLLPVRQAAFVMSTYLLLGFIGLPVFAAGASGPGKLFGPTGGYMFGFLVAVALIAHLRGGETTFRKNCLLGVAVGIPIIYFFGVTQLKIVTGMDWSKAVLVGAVPFIPLDVLKCVGAAWLAVPLQRFFK